MSRWWPDQLGVALFADRLVLARASSGWKRRLKDKQAITFAPAAPDKPQWQPAVDALAERVAAGAMTQANVTLVLSSSFLHYALLPWNEVLGSESEELAYARHCFARVYGADAESWELRLSRKSPGKSRLACAVDAALLDALNRVMAPLGESYCSLQPYLMASFNRWFARLADKPCWFVAAEPGVLCLSLLENGQWQSVRTIKVNADWLHELPAMLNREICLVDTATECSEVWIFSARPSQPVTFDAGKWHITNLMPALLPGMDAGADAEYAIALIA